jgi:hypothetical protein
MPQGYSSNSWWQSDEERVNEQVLAYVSEVERQQSYLFERFYRLGALFDPYFAYLSGYHIQYDGAVRGRSRGGRGGAFSDGDVSENVIASAVESVTAIIAATEVRSRFMTDDGDWSAQRQARHREWYVEGLGKRLNKHAKATEAFKDSSLKGTGLVKVYADHDAGEVVLERTLIDDIVVDEGETRAGEPRQLHQRVFVDRDVLKARFPGFEHEIDNAQIGGPESAGSWRLWAEYRAVERNQVVVIESWYLPIGKKGTPHYKAGRHTIVIPGTDLFDEEWHKPYFPFARMVWITRATGWYGIGAAERIAGHQRRLNKLNWQVDRQQDQLAVPTTFVRMADAKLAVQTTSRAGTIVPYKADIPKTEIPQAVSPETYMRLQAVKESAFEEVGLSRLAASAKKPAGLDSGIALREYRDMTTQRFSLQEKRFEQLNLDIDILMLEAAKDLGERAPVVLRKTRYGARKLEIADLDIDELRVQIAAASNISRTPAGRLQLALEWAQAGIITQDEARRLMQHPDLERAMSLYTAALEDIERTIEELLDGEHMVPEPFQNLKMGTWRVQQSYLKAKGDGAPDEILEALRQWIVQAAYVLASQAEAQAMTAAMAAGPNEQQALAPAPAPESQPLMPSMIQGGVQ